MSKVYIEYNPYTIETIFKINGEEVKSQTKYKSIANKKNKRLQYYIEADDKNWEGLIKELIKIINSKNIDIEFKGRKIDYDDLEHCILKYKNDNPNAKFNINLKYIKAKEDKDIHKNFCKLIEKVQNSPIKELQNPIIQDAINEGISTDFKMSVLANDRSGKSTLINALIGNDLLPSSNKACTSTIVRIRDNDNKNEFTVECRDKNGNIVYDKKVITFNNDNIDCKITPDKIEEYNNDKNVMYIDIEGSIPEISSQKMNLVLQDIHVSNKSVNENHNKIIDTIIDDKDKGIVLYIINATQVGIKDDKELLERISKSMKSEGKQSKDRFIFVVNKCDRINTEKESLSELLKQIKDDLKKYYDIKNPNIFPVSAQMAKMIRMNKQGINHKVLEDKFFRTYEDYIEYEELHFDKLSTLSQSSRIKLEEKLNKAKENDDKYEEVLIHTGVPAIEITINEYLEKYAYPTKINKSIEQIQNFIQEENIMNKLYTSLSQDKYSGENIRNQIDIVKRNIQKVELLKDKIDKLGFDELKLDEIDITLDCIIDEIEDMINNKHKVEEPNARVMISNIKSKLDAYEKNTFKELKHFFNENIVKEVKKIINEYYKYVEDLIGEISIEKFKFDNKVELKNAKIEDIDSSIDKYKKIESGYKQINHKYSYFLYAEKEQIYINIEEMIKPKLKDFEVSMLINIESIRILSSDCIEALKFYLKEQIEIINKFVEPEINKLDKLIKNEEKINKKIKEGEYRVDNMCDINLYLNELLEI